jgi:8-oxo-dGTP diphosphatase
MAKAVIRVVAAVIEHEGRYLLTQRNPAAVFPLLWEFPGGRVEMGETDQQALVREVAERVGVEVEVVKKLGEHVHEYDEYEIHMGMFACTLPTGALPRPVAVNDLRWVTSSDLDQYEFPPADQRSVARLLGLDRC